jgi:hypothetical protein
MARLHITVKRAMVPVYANTASETHYVENVVVHLYVNMKDEK